MSGVTHEEVPRSGRLLRAARVGLVAYLALILVTFWGTWSYETRWAGRLDGLQDLYLDVLGLPWSLLPIPSPWRSDHGVTAFVALLCLVNWVLVAIFVRRFVTHTKRADGHHGHRPADAG